jgi:hypothetical protein
MAGQLLQLFTQQKCVLVLVMGLLFLKAGLCQEFPAFKPLRYNEDYHFLRSDSTMNWYEKTKYTPLSANGNTYVSLGADIRFQYFYIDNENFGDEPKDRDGYTLSRLLVHADIHAGKQFRTFLQLQTSMANGKTGNSPVDENPLELHQAFFDINNKPGKKINWLLRTGRQEFMYGSQRLISVREGPNNRQSFDAVKAVISTSKCQADFFYSHFVAAKKGIFNDGWNRNTKLWGSYWVIKSIPFLQNVDAYYLGLRKSNAVFDDAVGKEIRHSFGTRIWGKKGNWRYDIEALNQSGKAATKKISEWTD